MIVRLPEADRSETVIGQPGQHIALTTRKFLTRTAEVRRLSELFKWAYDRPTGSLSAQYMIH